MEILVASSLLLSGFLAVPRPIGLIVDLGADVMIRVPDGEKALRYNLHEPVLGRGQVARHRVLVPGSQVRILPPQPRTAR